MNVGARNQINAEVTDIKKGDVMSRVSVKLKDANNVVMSSVMTTESLDAMGLKAGDTVQVLCKAVNVLLAKN